MFWHIVIFVITVATVPLYIIEMVRRTKTGIKFLFAFAVPLAIFAFGIYLMIYGEFFVRGWSGFALVLNGVFIGGFGWLLMFAVTIASIVEHAHNRKSSNPKKTIERIKNMPVLSVFYGIIITMYPKQEAKHHLPHFHAEYAEFQAVFTLDGELISGNFPPKQRAFVKAWALLREDELAADWKLAVNGEEVFRIEPLR